MGAEPIRDVLAAGADVVIAGRSSDCAIFAAPLLNAGHSAADAFFCGKAMECASFCGEPFMGKETILGRVDGTGVYLTAMHPDQRCTPASVASHAMYERLNPFREYVPGGYLDMTHCRYEQVDEKTTRVTGQTFVPSPTTWIKLEGSGKVAERALFIVGIRDPYTIANLDRAIGWAKGKLAERFGPIGQGYDVFYHVYGRNAVMEAMEPTPARAPLEVGIVVEVVCDDAARAETICHIAGKNLFYARLPDVKGTAGTAAIMSDEVLHARPAYEWTLNHVIEVADPRELFRTRIHTIRAGDRGDLAREARRARLDHPQQERRRRPHHVRRHLPRSRELRARARQQRAQPRRRRPPVRHRRGAASPTSWCSSRPRPSSSPSAGCGRAAAWARAISSARSNTRHCSTSRSPDGSDQ